MRRRLDTIDLVDVMPPASHLQGRAAAEVSDHTLHPGFVHRTSNAVVFDYNVSAMRRSVGAHMCCLQRHSGIRTHISHSARTLRGEGSTQDFLHFSTRSSHLEIKVKECHEVWGSQC